ncbi:hypothetical protein M9H77_03621 [Catharanthus roseus]|uniref:Uncharacterized protein n=1 Tax=Catharanthus roseus TaxID=4058 RepID=A0ACC0CCA4_CATRO|nr:hypothetical protein M9H77_03621 [Catharanthus roseus]
MNAKTYLIITQYQRSRTADRRPYVTLACEGGGSVKKYKKAIVDDEEEEVLKKRQGPVQKIYNVVAKIKRNQMQGRNTVEEVLCLSAERGYKVFHRNREESNVLSDIVVAHPTSNAMIRTWPYVMIMDTTHKKNKYNMPLLEVVGMTPIGKNFTVVTAFMCNEQATTYRWVLQQIKHLYFTSAMSNGQGSIINQEEPLVILTERESGLMSRKLEVLKTRWKSRPDFLHYLFSTWLNPFAYKFCRVWTSQVLHFVVETTNRAESEHSVLKVWLSTCHGDLDTVFLNIDSLIQCKIAEIKYTLEISKLREKYGAKSNAILKNLSNKISHLALKKIMDELKKAREMVEEPGSNCLHYLRKSHSLPFKFDHCPTSCFQHGWYYWNTCHRIPRGTTAFHTATLARWMPFASTTGAMGISSRRTS